MKKLILFSLILSILIGSAFAFTCGPTDLCDPEGMVIKFTQGRACYNDTLIVVMSNFSNCENHTFNLYYNDKLLCNDPAPEKDFALCIFKVPDTGNIGPENLTLRVEISDCPGFYIEKNLTVRKRTTFGICKDARGNDVDCGYECSDVILRKWKEVKPVSLPMHFTFATRGQLSNLPNYFLSDDQETLIYNILGNENETIENCGEVNCSCPPSQLEIELPKPGELDIPTHEVPTEILEPRSNCKYDEYKLVRNSYSWSISYDAVVSVMSKKEFVPIYVGRNQTPVNVPELEELMDLKIPTPLGTIDFSKKFSQELSSPCVGDNKLCYTQIPICGDSICDTDAGERCWNCPHDCGFIMDNFFEGNCGIDNSGCSRCPRVDETFTDERSCIIRYKDVGENCTCNAGMCDPNKGLQCTFEAYDPKTGMKSTIYPGKCCYKDEVWFTGPSAGDPSGPHCEKLRKIDIDEIKLKVKGPSDITISEGDYLAQLLGTTNTISKEHYREVCCFDRKDAAWATLKLTLRNKGPIREKVKVRVWLDPEKEGSGTSFLGVYQFSNLYGGINYAREKEVTMDPNSQKTVDFGVFSCVRTKQENCRGSIDCIEGLQCTSGDHPALHIQILIDDPCIYESHTNGPTHSHCYYNQFLGHSEVISDGKCYAVQDIICDLVTGTCNSEKLGISITGKIRAEGSMTICGGTERLGWVPEPLKVGETTIGARPLTWYNCDRTGNEAICGTQSLNKGINELINEGYCSDFDEPW